MPPNNKFYNPVYEMAMNGRSTFDTGFLEAITRYPIITGNGALKVNFEKRLTEYGEETLSMRVYLCKPRFESTVLAYNITNHVYHEGDKRLEELLMKMISQVYSAMDIPFREIPLKLHNQSDVTTLVFKWRLEHGI